MNLLLTLCDVTRVADDVGKIRFQLKVTQMPLMGWKGSFVVSKVSGRVMQVSLRSKMRLLICFCYDLKGRSREGSEF